MKYLLAMTAFLFLSTGFAGTQNIILKLKEGTNIHSLGFHNQAVTMSPLVQSMQIQFLRLQPQMDVNETLKKLRQHPRVIYAQLDHPVSLRNKPNDEDFDKQWSMVYNQNTFGIDAVKTWSTFGTGGKDVRHNDVVVAVVDGGMQIDHPDLADNLWTNKHEIADNGIDDDGNGYIDDIHGWNAFSDNGDINSDYHGTHVAGIIGARGNNEKQVAGVNWNIKIMAVPGSSGSTSTVLRAYNYILKQKQLWLSSNGSKGANIVATNSSFGVDFANCESGDYPAWNDIYTAMGEVGILSAAATANNSINVDQQGDVPTGCSSPYLITVTNTGKSGARAYAGYGLKSIDLAAPGQNIYSTISGSGASSLSGTSMATPHVAGAVGYLHSVASKTLNKLFVTNPADAALEMKKIILSSVNKTSELQSETVSGGILNLYDSATSAAEYGLGYN